MTARCPRRGTRATRCSKPDRTDLQGAATAVAAKKEDTSVTAFLLFSLSVPAAAAPFVASFFFFRHRR